MVGSVLVVATGFTNIHCGCGPPYLTFAIFHRHKNNNQTPTIGESKKRLPPSKWRVLSSLSQYFDWWWLITTAMEVMDSEQIPYKDVWTWARKAWVLFYHWEILVNQRFLIYAGSIPRTCQFFSALLTLEPVTFRESVNQLNPNFNNTLSSSVLIPKNTKNLHQFVDEC